MPKQSKATMAPAQDLGNDILDWDINPLTQPQVTTRSPAPKAMPKIKTQPVPMPKQTSDIGTIVANILLRMRQKNSVDVPMSPEEQAVFDNYVKRYLSSGQSFEREAGRQQEQLIQDNVTPYPYEQTLKDRADAIQYDNLIKAYANRNSPVREQAPVRDYSGQLYAPTDANLEATYQNPSADWNYQFINQEPIKEQPQTTVPITTTPIQQTTTMPTTKPVIPAITPTATIPNQPTQPTQPTNPMTQEQIDLIKDRLPPEILAALMKNSASGKFPWEIRPDYYNTINRGGVGITQALLDMLVKSGEENRILKDYEKYYGAAVKKDDQGRYYTERPYSQQELQQQALNALKQRAMDIQEGGQATQRYVADRYSITKPTITGQNALEQQQGWSKLEKEKQENRKEIAGIRQQYAKDRQDAGIVTANDLLGAFATMANQQKR